MLALTRLNGHRFFVNGDLIKYSEAAPDTVLALVTGEKLIVTESPEEVMLAMLRYRAEVLRTAWPEASAALGAKLASDAQDLPGPQEAREHSWERNREHNKGESTRSS
jgi:flagellar protein FlbD